MTNEERIKLLLVAVEFLLRYAETPGVDEATTALHAKIYEEVVKGD